MKRKLGAKGQIVIPKEIREKLNLKEGATMTFETAEDSIVVRPEPAPDEIVRRFLSVKGKKRGKLVDWKSVIEEEYSLPDP